MIKEILIRTSGREQFIDITEKISIAIEGVKEGVITIFVPHTTAAVTINEGADPDVKIDMLEKLGRSFPDEEYYRHGEGNSDAHIKTTLVGSSEQVIIQNNKLVLGTWQSIYFCEFDGPRNRKVIIKF